MAPCAHYQPTPSNGRNPPPPPVGSQQPPVSPATAPCPPGEPPMNRYVHPVVSQRPFPLPEAADIHFLQCALTYQNQVLADIKTLLQALVQQGADSDG